MGEFGPTLHANEECVVPEGQVKVVGHGRHLLSPHLDVEVTADGTTETQQWHDEDVVAIGKGAYIVNFIHFDDFVNGVPVAHLVLAGEIDDPEFRRAEARAAEAGMSGFIP
jgi:hypothetical protein